MHNYILIPNIKVKNLNVNSSLWLINESAIMAIDGFVHNLSRTVNVETLGFSILHHTSDLIAERSYNQYNFHKKRTACFINKTDYAQGMTNFANQPLAECDLELSIIIHIERRVNPKIINNFVNRGRIGGGSIQSYGEIRFSTNLNDLQIPYGYWLIDRSDIMQNYLDDGINQIDALIKERIKENPNIIPAVVGYGLLTNLKEKDGVRLPDNQDICEHAFCEPMVGFIEYVKKEKNQTSIPMWYNCWIDDEFYIIKQ